MEEGEGGLGSLLAAPVDPTEGEVTAVEAKDMEGMEEVAAAVEGAEAVVQVVEATEGGGTEAVETVAKMATATVVVVKEQRSEQC